MHQTRYLRTLFDNSQNDEKSEIWCDFCVERQELIENVQYQFNFRCRSKDNQRWNRGRLARYGGYEWLLILLSSYRTFAHVRISSQHISNDSGDRNAVASLQIWREVMWSDRIEWIITCVGSSLCCAMRSKQSRTATNEMRKTGPLSYQSMFVTGQNCICIVSRRWVPRERTSVENLNFDRNLKWVANVLVMVSSSMPKMKAGIRTIPS